MVSVGIGEKVKHQKHGFGIVTALSEYPSKVWVKFEGDVYGEMRVDEDELERL